MNQEKAVFVICRRDDHKGPCCYAAHGTVGGMDDAIGYDSKVYAKKFLSESDAEEFISCVMPQWARNSHYPMEVKAHDLLWDNPRLSAAMQGFSEITPDMLNPPGARLLIWRR